MDRWMGFITRLRIKGCRISFGMRRFLDNIPDTAPKEVVPGTIMTYLGLKDEREAGRILIAYLETLH